MRLKPSDPPSSAELGLCLVLAVAACNPTPHRESSFVAGGAACTDEVELIGFSDALDKTQFGGFHISHLSALAYDADRNVYYALPDNQPGGIPSHFFAVEIPVLASGIGIPRVLDVTVLRREDGTPFDGRTFDGEGMVLTPGRELIIASEGGVGPAQQPEIRRFALDGTHLGELPVPERFRIGPNNESFESLALSPSGRILYTMFERPLPEDGEAPGREGRLRILAYTEGPQGYVPVREYFYLLEAPTADGPGPGAVEIVALNEDELLVLEREFTPGYGNTIRVFRVLLAAAEDVSDRPSLAAAGLDPVVKELVVDLESCPAAGATSRQVQPHPLLDNFEAMVLGPTLSDGRRALLLVSDDNANQMQVTRIVALTLPDDMLVRPSER